MNHFKEYVATLLVFDFLCLQCVGISGCVYACCVYAGMLHCGLVHMFSVLSGLLHACCAL